MRYHDFVGTTRRWTGLAGAAALALAVSGCAKPALAPAPAPPAKSIAPEGDDVNWDDGPDADHESRVETTGRVLDARGEPIGGLTVRIFQGKEHVLETTQDDGRFAAQLPASGSRYTVETYLRNGTPKDCPLGRCRPGSISAGEKDAVFRLPYSRVELARGRVVDADGAPLCGWSVVARRNDARSFADATASTDERGTFRITAWERSDFTLKLSSPRGGSRRIVKTFVAEGEAAPTLVAGPPGIAGRVTSRSGAAPTGALVRIRHADDPAFERTSVVDAGGEFRFEDLPTSEEYELTAELAGWDLLHPVRCAVDTGDQKLELLAPHQTITGSLLAPDGAPRIATWLRFLPANANGGRVFQTITGTDGAFVTHEARDVEYVVSPLVEGADGRLVPGPAIGRCRGGARDVVLRATR